MDYKIENNIHQLYYLFIGKNVLFVASYHQQKNL